MCIFSLCGFTWLLAWRYVTICDISLLGAAMFFPVEKINLAHGAYALMYVLRWVAIFILIFGTKLLKKFIKNTDQKVLRIGTDLSSWKSKCLDVITCLAVYTSSFKFQIIQMIQPQCYLIPACIFNQSDGRCWLKLWSWGIKPLYLSLSL